MAYATTADVQVRLARELAGPETDAADTLLNDAETMLVHGVPDLHDRAGDTTTDYMDRVVMVESAMVVRVLRNPGGYRTQAEGGTLSQIDTRAAAGFLLVLDDEWALLRDDTGTSAVWSVAPSFPGTPWIGGDVWRPLSPFNG